MNYTSASFQSSLYAISIILIFIWECNYINVYVCSESGISVVDVGCGVGVSTRIMAEHFPNSRFIGIDISDDLMKEALAQAANQNLRNVEFVCASAMDMDRDWSEKFDFLFMYNLVHDASRPEKVLQECLRVLKPGAMVKLLQSFISEIM